MADNWTDWYSGSMAPPVRMPGGGYAPAPVPPAMSVEEIYRGILSPTGNLSSVSRPTVPINPRTGMPYAPTVNASAAYAGGIGAGASGSADIRRKVEIPNPVYGPDPVPKYQDRLPAVPAGLPLAVLGPPITIRNGKVVPPQIPGSANARGQLGAGGFANGSFSFPAKAADDGMIHLSDLDLSDRGAQAMADSEGKPIIIKGGKIFYPGGKPPAGRPQYQPGAGKPPAQRQGLLAGLFGNPGSSGGGLFGGLFGGGQQSSAPSALAAKQTAPYAPGTTFEQRAAAASRRESLMNPPTETNWAAIEASAKNRR